MDIKHWKINSFRKSTFIEHPILFYNTFIFSNFLSVFFFLSWINKPKNFCTVYYLKAEVSGSFTDNFYKWEALFHVGLSVFSLDKWNVFLISCAESETTCWLRKRPSQPGASPNRVCSGPYQWSLPYQEDAWPRGGRASVQHALFQEVVGFPLKFKMSSNRE